MVFGAALAMNISYKSFAAAQKEEKIGILFASYGDVDKPEEV
jgi:hypothetical protein